MHHRPGSSLRHRVGLVGATALLTGALHAQVLTPTTDEHRVAHLLRRSSFGPLPGQAEALSTPFPGAILAHLDQQLTGTVPEAPDFAQRLAQFGVPADPTSDPNFGNWTIRDLSAWVLYRMAYSNNQLNECLTAFWSQQFSTSYFKQASFFNDNPTLTSGLTMVPSGDRGAVAAAYCEYLQNQAFRTHALGTFRDLLTASVKAPSMLIYLDSHTNDLPVTSNERPNENFAREFFELHTLGVSPFSGFPFFYNFDPDIRQTAYAWTGWKVVQNTTSAANGSVSWEFQFDGSNHTDAVGTILTNPANFPMTAFDFSAAGRTGVLQGEDLIDHIAGSLETNIHVCSRLIELFTGFRPPLPGFDPSYQAGALQYPTGLPNFEIELITLLGNCAAVWGPDGDISAVVEMILKSPLMQDPRVYWSLARNHVEYTANLLRSLTPADPDYAANELRTICDILENDCDQKLFRFPSPDGFPIHSDEQLSTSSYNYRIAIARTIDTTFVHPDPTGTLGGHDPGELNWYTAQTYLPNLLTIGTPIGKYYALAGYLATYPAVGPNLDLGNDQAVVDHVLDLMFQGHVHPATRTLATNYLSSLQASHPALPNTTLAQLLPACNPVTNPTAWYTIFTEVGHRLVQLVVYVVSLPQAQLK